MITAGPRSAPTQQANPLDTDALEQEDNAQRHPGQYTPQTSTQSRGVPFTQASGSTFANSRDELL